MIIYGSSGAKQVSTKKLTVEKCHYCESINSLDLTVYTGYYHIYGVPFFHFGKKVNVRCSSCGKDIKSFQLSPSTLKQVEKEKENIKFPFWYFSGIFIAAALICAIGFGIHKTKLNNEKYLKDPKKNDVYEFKNEVGHYTLFKINEVTNDSVLVFFNNYESTSNSGLSELDDSIKYDHENIYILAKSQLWEMYENKKILNVNRD